MTPEQRKIAEGLANGLNTRQISAKIERSYHMTNSMLAVMKQEFRAINSPNLIAILFRKGMIK